MDCGDPKAGPHACVPIALHNVSSLPALGFSYLAGLDVGLFPEVLKVKTVLGVVGG